MRGAPPFSLRFALGPTPVLVEPSFWLVMALFQLHRPTPYILTWVLTCFVSVLLHELGHATAARAFGSDTAIRLYSFGGLTFHRPLGRWQEVLVSLAGPFTGFVFGGLMWFLLDRWPPEGRLGQVVAADLMWVNFGWGLINLMPVPPLDGGHVLLGLVGPRRRTLGYVLGMAAAAGVVLLAWALRQPFLGVMFALLGFQSYQAWQAERAARATPSAPPPTPRPAEAPPVDVSAALAPAWAALRGGDEREAARLALQVLDAARTPEERNGARDVLAWVALAEGDARSALSHLERVHPPEAARPLTRALALEAAGQPERALPHALAALGREPSDSSASLAVRLLLSQGRLEEAEQTCRTFPWGRPALRDAHLADVAAARGDFAGAAQLWGSAFEAGGRPEDAYRAACGHARAGQGEHAHAWLKRALEAGWDDLDALAREPALAEVRTREDIAAHLAQR